jgi:hypothetical protein
MELKDWLNSINFTKEDLSEDMSSYPPYIINRCLSGHLDCVMYANEMNLHHHLDKDMQYSFYLNSLRKRKRFSPWLRKDKKASQALKILTKEQINFIKQRLDIGGAK